MKLSIPLFAISLAIVSACGSNHPENNTTTENAITGNVIQEPQYIDISFTELNSADIPVDCVFKGKIIDANSWYDVNGKNYFIRTIGDLIDFEGEGGGLESTMSQTIYTYHYTEVKGEFMLVHEIIDAIENCQFDLMISHVVTGISLTDIDNDNVGEISFVYRMTCTSDVSSSTQKLFMLEGDDKYALLGETEVMEQGGEFEADENFASAPDGFLSHAEKLWEENRTEYDFEL